MRTRIALALLLAALAGSATAVGGEARRADSSPCPPVPVDPVYDHAVNNALAAKRDVWGDELLRAPEGPTYEGIRRHLHPVMLVGPPSGTAPNRLTDSGIYYLAFGRPTDADGSRSVDLHVADGSQIVSEWVKRARMSVDVGVHAGERFGSCLARLGPARLGGGYLPILKTSYVDADGVAYRQESFATRIRETGSLVSFVRITVDPRGSGVHSARVRFTPSVPGLRRVGNQLRGGRDAFMLFAPGGRVHRGAVTYTTRGRRPRTVYAAWLARPSPVRPFRLGRRSYERARRSVGAYWNRRLARGATFLVPDQRVVDAERNLLIQNLLHTWRYSLANKYERFSWEMIDVAQVLGEYGFARVERSIVEKSFHRDSVFPNRADGERMSGTADYYRRTGDTRFVTKVTPWLRGALERFEFELNYSTNGLLDPERYGVDIGTPVYGLHDQALVLQGLRAMAEAWRATSRPVLAVKATGVADRLEAGLLAAVRASQQRLADGSLFIPVVLLEGTEQPYESVTQSLQGSYWNLVAPYAFASGLFPPGSPEAAGVLGYMANHGSRLLGLVRFRAYLESGKAGYRASGVDDVYGTNVVRFLADNDQPDQLILSLYGKLGADMAPGTFVSGEGSTVGPVAGEYYRSMFRPPNSANNAFFLETLRLMLLHETPGGLELAYATPRAWLEPGQRIAVRGASTSFGPLSYSLAARTGSVRVSMDVPPGLGSRSLKLRLRLPAGERIAGASIEGRAYPRFERKAETIDLTGLSGHVELLVATSSP